MTSVTQLLDPECIPCFSLQPGLSGLKMGPWGLRKMSVLKFMPHGNALPTQTPRRLGSRYLHVGIEGRDPCLSDLLFCAHVDFG